MAANGGRNFKNLELKELSNDESKSVTEPTPQHIKDLENIIKQIDDELHGAEQENGLFFQFLIALSEGYLSPNDKININDEPHKQLEAIKKIITAKKDAESNSWSGTYSKYVTPSKEKLIALCDAFVTLWGYLKVSDTYTTLPELKEYFQQIDTEMEQLLKNALSKIKDSQENQSFSNNKEKLFKYVIHLYKELAIKRFYLSKLKEENLNPVELSRLIEQFNIPAFDKDISDPGIAETNFNAAQERFNQDAEVQKRVKLVQATLRKRDSIVDSAHKVAEEQSKKAKNWGKQAENLTQTYKTLSAQYFHLTEQHKLFSKKLELANSQPEHYSSNTLILESNALKKEIEEFNLAYEKFLQEIAAHNQAIQREKSRSLESIDALNPLIKTWKAKLARDSKEKMEYVNLQAEALTTAHNIFNSKLDQIVKLIELRLEKLKDERLKIPSSEYISECIEIRKELNTKFEDLEEQADICKQQYRSLTSIASYAIDASPQRWGALGDAIKHSINKIKGIITTYTSTSVDKDAGAPGKHVWSLLNNQIPRTHSTVMTLHQQLNQQRQNLQRIQSAASNMLTNDSISSDTKQNLQHLKFSKDTGAALDSALLEARQQIEDASHLLPSFTKLDLAQLDLSKLNTAYGKALTKIEKKEGKGIELTTLHIGDGDGRKFSPSQARKNTRRLEIVPVEPKTGVKGFLGRHLGKIVFTGIFVAALAVGFATAVGWIPVIAGFIAATAGATSVGISVTGLIATAPVATGLAYGAVGTTGLLVGMGAGVTAGAIEDCKHPPIKPHKKTSSRPVTPQEQDRLLDDDGLGSSWVQLYINKTSLPAYQTILNVFNFAKRKDEKKANFASTHDAFQRLIDCVRNQNSSPHYDPTSDLEIFEIYKQEMESSKEKQTVTKENNIVPIKKVRGSADKDVSVTQFGQFQPLRVNVESVKQPKRRFGCFNF